MLCNRTVNNGIWLYLVVPLRQALSVDIHVGHRQSSLEVANKGLWITLKDIELKRTCKESEYRCIAPNNEIDKWIIYLAAVGEFVSIYLVATNPCCFSETWFG
jgi:hypothetical protein